MKMVEWWPTLPGLIVKAQGQELLIGSGNWDITIFQYVMELKV